MKRVCRFLPVLIVLGLGLGMALHGPIEQPEHYHHFADTRDVFGLQNAADVLSNLGFAVVAIWGWLRLGHKPDALGTGGPGYRMFLAALLLTAAGSFYYHLHPDDARLVWDRIPIALVCAGLLAAVHGETVCRGKVARNTLALGLAAVASVLWWYRSGDLRPYLLMQALPLLLIPVWQQLYHVPRADRRAFGIAILLYILAKVVEFKDHEILAMTGVISGHTLKHLLTTGAAAAIVVRLAQRPRN